MFHSLVCRISQNASCNVHGVIDECVDDRCKCKDGYTGEFCHFCETFCYPTNNRIQEGEVDVISGEGVHCSCKCLMFTVYWWIYTNFNILTRHYRHGHPKLEFPRNMLLMKNLQFLSNFAQTFTDWSSNGWINYSKFEQNRTNIVNFLLIAYFFGIPT